MSGAHSTSYVLLFWFNSAHPDYLDSQGNFYAATIKGVGRFYQQTFINTYSKWSKPNSTRLDQAPLPARRPLQAPICSMIDAAFLAEQGKGLIPILATGGTQRLPINDIEHSKTKANYPATNGILEAFV